MDSRLWWKNSTYTRNYKEPWQDSRKVPRRTSVADRYIQKDIDLKSAESTDARAIRRTPKFGQPLDLTNIWVPIEFYGCL